VVNYNSDLRMNVPPIHYS